MVNVKNIQPISSHVCSTLITFGDMGLIKYVEIRFRPSLLIVFQIVFCFKKIRRAGKTRIPVCMLQFLKTIFYSQNTRRIRKTREHFNLVPSFVCFEKHIEHKTLNSNDKKSFQKIPKLCFLCFQKLFLKQFFKNSFKRHEPNKPISLFFCFKKNTKFR